MKTTTTKRRQVLGLVLAAFASASSLADGAAIRVGTYNIRHSRGGGKLIDQLDGENFWELRKADTGGGKLRQGLNTFVVTAEGGEFTGVARDVDVGWDLVTDVAIELKTGTASFPSFYVDPSNATERVRIVRTAINGQEFRRTVWKSPEGVTGGVFAEVDLVDGKTGYDFDWKTLLSDAEYMQIAQDEIRTVSYEVVSGTNVVGIYEKTFPVTRTRPNLVRATENDLEKVLSARPTFVWKGGEGVTAFRAGDRVATSWSSHSEFVCLPASQVYSVPDGVSFEDAAWTHISTFPMAALRKCRLEIGEGALVMGQGVLGQLAVKLLRAAGATPVLAADPEKVMRMKKLEQEWVAPFDKRFRGVMDELNVACGKFMDDEAAKPENKAAGKTRDDFRSATMPVVKTFVPKFRAIVDDAVEKAKTAPAEIAPKLDEYAAGLEKWIKMIEEK